MAAETHTTPTSATPTSAARNGGSATGTFAIPAAARRQAGPVSWAVRAARAGAAPRGTRPEPRLRQLMGVCGWAAVLGGVGLVVGIRGFFGVLAGDAATWYEPALITVGALGLAFTVGGFLTVDRRRTPWIMLGAASVVLIVAMVLTSRAF